jgi:hypothetical protein
MCPDPGLRTGVLVMHGASQSAMGVLKTFAPKPDVFRKPCKGADICT